jgi:adenine/guanine phosphoribosyltransferase-like PRPP-binding protein
MRVDRRVTDRDHPPDAITLVDDVITMGATLRGGASLLAEAFPHATIRAFALVRTLHETFEHIIDPVRGEIRASWYHGGAGTYHTP